MRLGRRIVAAAGAGLAVALLVVGGVAVSRIAADPAPARTAVPTPAPDSVGHLTTVELPFSVRTAPAEGLVGRGR
jgi:hypothetical protein